MQALEGHRQRAFALWLRTGRRVQEPVDSQIERKFNPWHDPRDGRFTFAGAGRYAGPGGGGLARPVRRRAPPTDYVEDFTKPPLASLREADAWRARELAKYRGEPEQTAVIEARYQRYRQAFAPKPDAPLIRVASRVAGFAGGVGDFVHDSGKSAVGGVHSLVTTNPLTTIQNAGRGIAGMIDGIVEAEDTPASAQISRAAKAIANASAHDVGYGAAAVVTGVGSVFVPSAIVAKIASAGRVAEVGAATTAIARFGSSTSRNYRATFFNAYPGTRGSVFVHHAVEQRVLRKYPGVVSESEMHSLENLRGIPKKLNPELHLRKIRREWDAFDRDFEGKNVLPTKEQLLKKAHEIDVKYGYQFRPAR